MAVGVGTDADGCDPSREEAIGLNIIDDIERTQ
jgi:hypothetical protein